METVDIVIMEFNKKETAYLCIFNSKVEEPTQKFVFNWMFVQKEDIKSCSQKVICTIGIFHCLNVKTHHENLHAPMLSQKMSPYLSITTVFNQLRCFSYCLAEKWPSQSHHIDEKSFTQHTPLYNFFIQNTTALRNKSSAFFSSLFSTAMQSTYILIILPNH